MDDAAQQATLRAGFSGEQLALFENIHRYIETRIFACTLLVITRSFNARLLTSTLLAPSGKHRVYVVTGTSAAGEPRGGRRKGRHGPPSPRHRAASAGLPGGAARFANSRRGGCDVLHNSCRGSQCILANDRTAGPSAAFHICTAMLEGIEAGSWGAGGREVLGSQRPESQPSGNGWSRCLRGSHHFACPKP